MRFVTVTAYSINGKFAKTDKNFNREMEFLEPSKVKESSYHIIYLKYIWFTTISWVGQKQINKNNIQNVYTVKIMIIFFVTFIIYTFLVFFYAKIVSKGNKNVIHIVLSVYQEEKIIQQKGWTFFIYILLILVNILFMFSQKKMMLSSTVQI